MQNDAYQIRQMIGENIRLNRRRTGLTQEQFTEKTDLSVQLLSGLENGLQFARMDTYVKIADACGVAVFELLRPVNISFDEVTEETLRLLLSDRSEGQRESVLRIMREIVVLLQDCSS